jgi:hypothetical protein
MQRNIKYFKQLDQRNRTILHRYFIDSTTWKEMALIVFFSGIMIPGVHHNHCATIDALTYYPSCLCLRSKNIGHLHDGRVSRLPWQTLTTQDEKRFRHFVQALSRYARLISVLKDFITAPKCIFHQHAPLLPYPSLVYIHYNFDHIHVLVLKNSAGASTGHFGNPSIDDKWSIFEFLCGV